MASPHGLKQEVMQSSPGLKLFTRYSKSVNEIGKWLFSSTMLNPGQFGMQVAAHRACTLGRICTVQGYLVHKRVDNWQHLQVVISVLQA